LRAPCEHVINRSCVVTQAVNQNVLRLPYVATLCCQAARARARLSFVGTTSRPPKWIKPQLTCLVDEAPTGDGWVHEIKYDGYRMHARIDGRDIKLLTRTDLYWSHRYRRTIEALGTLKVKSAYLDGELCALDGYGVPVFSRLQAAMDEGSTDQLVFFPFDLLYLNGDRTTQLALLERKKRLQPLFKKEIHGLRYSEHVVSDGPSFREHACKFGLEGVISKRRSAICARRLRYQYARRAGTGMIEKELKRLEGVLKPLQVPKMPLAEPQPRDSGFGSPLKLSLVHWVSRRWSWKSPT
jgi:bifunctional non-homologous end joining protein LigD